MLIHKSHLLTKIQIWAPRYSDKYSGTGEWTVLLAKYKVHHATSVMLIEFTKAKHLKGERFCITRDKAQRCPVTTNGKIECYAVPLSEFDTWDTPAEVLETINEIWGTK